MVKAHSKDLEKFKSKIGSEWASEFRDKTRGELEGEDFNKAFEDFLSKDLRFSEEVEVEGQDTDLSIGVKGCHICFGNDELKREGEPTLYPIVPTGLFSISRVGKRRATLDEVHKTGTVGECEIRYKLR